MGLGKLIERLVIQVNAAPLVRGAPAPADWQTLDTISAEQIAGSGGERLTAAKVESTFPVRFRVWARADITPAMRALWLPSWPPQTDRRIVQIASVSPDPMNRQFMFLDCLLSDAGGTA